MQSKIRARPPSIRIAFRTFGRTLRHGYDNIGTLGIASFFWMICTLPIIPLVILLVPFMDPLSVPLFITAVLMVGIGPPTAALHRITQPMSEERASRWNTFWEHLRADWRWSLRLVATLLVVLALLDANRIFYSRSMTGLLPFFSVFFFVITMVWVGILFFAVPITLRQSQLGLGTSLRNAAVIVLANLPGVIVSLALWFLSSLLLLIIPPLFVLLPGYTALWSEENVRMLLVASGIIPEDEIADRPRRGRG